MKLFKNYVEVKQTMIKKKSKVVMLDSSSDADKYDITQEVLQIGPDCKFVEIGNIPIISPYFQEYGRKLVSGDSKDGDEMVFHVIYSEDDFVGVE